MRLVDLTMPINAVTPVLPGDPLPEFRRLLSFEKDGINLHRVSMNTHFGTHIDSPWHMTGDGKRLSDFPIERFIGRAMLFDVRGQKEIDIDLLDSDFPEIVILRTDRTRLIGSPVFFKDNPVVGRRLAEKLAAKHVGMIGMDSHTVDNEPYEVHKILFKHEILILENLVNLDQIGSTTFTLLALPLKLDKLDGAPCRAVAQVGT
jgi:arylformamidase